MQDFSDNTLDALIERSLRYEARLRPGQQARAWEALRARVVAEAVEPVPAPAPRHNPLLVAIRWVIWMCLEESHYERAARQRRLESYPLALCGEPLGGGIWTTFRRELSA
jgi:hypothetical protein